MVLWHRTGEDADLRLGVVASKRTFRRAVDRNRAKRLLREVFRLNRHRFTGAVDVVLVARARIGEPAFVVLADELVRLAGQAGLCPSSGRGE